MSIVTWDDDDNEIETPLPEVRNCPRCGAKAAWEKDFERVYAIVCSDCGYHDTDEFFDSLDELAAWWNERPLEDALRERIAELAAQSTGPVLVPRLTLATGVLVEVDFNRQMVFVADGSNPHRVVRIPVNERRADVVRDMAVDLSRVSVILEFAERDK